MQKYIEEARVFAEDNPMFKDMIFVPKSFEDLFLPYISWITSLTEEKRNKYRIVPDENDVSFTGFFITDDPNVHYAIPRVTDYDEDEKLYDYGVADNATQIIKNVLLPENSVVLMLPIYKEDYEPGSGWRWQKWGPYYGIQTHKCEYLADEKDIEMVYAFRVVTLKRKENNNDLL